MYVDTATTSSLGKTYTRHLLRESYREGGKVKHRTIANLSHCSAEEVGAIRLALKHKSDLTQLGSVTEDVSLEQGVSIGALTTVYQTAKRLGIVDALGSDRQGTLALFQVFARILDQGSRLSSVRLAREHALTEVLGLSNFDEDDLYDNLDWCATHQSSIEDRLFKSKQTASDFFLYDVTSSYFEGTHNEMAAYGYNRDGKKGKMQVVAGLLCDAEGYPIAIELFKGNTPDPQTVAPQIEKFYSRFHLQSITLVGDRGMIKSEQIKLLEQCEITAHYITAITKPQIRRLLSEGTLQMNLFDSDVAEIVVDDTTRYVLRRNPIRAQEIACSRESKKTALLNRIDRENSYLATHPRASAEKAKDRISNFAKRLGIDSWTSIALADRALLVEIRQESLAQESALDGCYCLKTDISPQSVSKETIHERYKDLALFEQAFRSAKTSFLEIRPIFVVKESRTRGHALITMLAYKIVRELRSKWAHIDVTVAEGLLQLASLCLCSVKVKNSTLYHTVPTPRPSLNALLVAANIQMPTTVNAKPSAVSTKKKLTTGRIR